MPRYNGAVSYLIEVPLHLLWCYAVVSLLVPIFAVPLVIVALMSEEIFKTLFSSASAVLDAVPFILGALHFYTFMRFRQFVQPRFPYAPALLTFVVAALAGSVLLALAWTADRFSVRLVSEGLAGFREWADVMGRFSLAIVLAILGGTFGYMQRWTNQDVAPLSAVGAWMGRLIVGRETYDAFVAGEWARLEKEYDDYRKEIRRSA